MTKRRTGNILIVFCVFLLVFACSQKKNIKSIAFKHPYYPSDPLLYNTIIFQDSLLFDAFNSRNFELFKSFFSENLEIYQDNTGLRNFSQSMEAFSGLFSGDYILTRQLVKGSLEVYPIKDYGAIQTGQHTFCHTENGKPDCGTFKFVHIWELKNGQWKITKIITYDHKL